MCYLPSVTLVKHNQTRPGHFQKTKQNTMTARKARMRTYCIHIIRHINTLQTSTIIWKTPPKHSLCGLKIVETVRQRGDLMQGVGISGQYSKTNQFLSRMRDRKLKGGPILESRFILLCAKLTPPQVTTVLRDFFWHLHSGMQLVSFLNLEN